MTQAHTTSRPPIEPVLPLAGVLGLACLILAVFSAPSDLGVISSSLKDRERRPQDANKRDEGLQQQIPLPQLNVYYQGPPCKGCGDSLWNFLNYYGLSATQAGYFLKSPDGTSESDNIREAKREMLHKGTGYQFVIDSSLATQDSQ